MHLILRSYEEYGNKDRANDIHGIANMSNIAYIVDHGAEGCKLVFIDGEDKGHIFVRESFFSLNAILPPSIFLIMTAYCLTQGSDHDEGCETRVSINTSNVTWISSNKGQGGCKLKFVAGSASREISVRQYLGDIAMRLKPEAVYPPQPEDYQWNAEHKSAPSL